MDGWLSILKQKEAELELIASWASQVGYGRVRDYCRMAKHELISRALQRQTILDQFRCPAPDDPAPASTDGKAGTPMTDEEILAVDEKIGRVLPRDDPGVEY